MAFGRDIRENRLRREAEYWKKEIAINPQHHAEYEMERQKQTVLRPVDIKDPKYFNEKMLWLKYFLYNDSPLVAQCYNKYEVRKYIESKGLPHILNELYGAWDSVDEIDWEGLPEEYVMKVSNGYAGHVFKKKGRIFSIIDAKKQLSSTLEKYDYHYYLTGDLFTGATKQKIICERILHSSFGYDSPEDYKFHCFNGVPMYLDFLADRNSREGYKEFFMDLDLNDRSEYEGEAKPGTIEAPVCYSEMIEIARILSEDFPYVRVDLYVEAGKPVFGELTFTPMYWQTEKSLVEFGELLKLDDIDKYRKILSKAVE